MTIISFFFFLTVAEWAASKIVKAGLIGQIIVGLIYGVPIGNILALNWQETFVDLGYVGLILIVFEGMLPRAAARRTVLLTAQADSPCGWTC